MKPKAGVFLSFVHTDQYHKVRSAVCICIKCAAYDARYFSIFSLWFTITINSLHSQLFSPAFTTRNFTSTKMSLQQQLYVRIREKIAPAGNSFLIHKTGLLWDWPAPDLGFVQKAEHQLVGTMPAPIGPEGPYYAPGAGDIYNAYKTVFNSVEVVVSDEHQQQLQGINDKLDVAMREKQGEYATYLAQWKAAGLPDSEKEEWNKMMAWTDRLEKHDKAIESLKKNRDEIIAAADEDREEARKAIKDEKDGFVLMVVGLGGQTRKLPNFEVSENGLKWAQRVANGKGNVTSIQLSSSYVHDNQSNTDVNFEAGVKLFGFIPIGASGEVDASKQTLDNEDGITEISIEFEALTTVSVTPDPAWYKSAYLTKMAKLSSWKDKLTNEQVFGSNGIFPSVITGFAAAYRPTIKISASSNTISKLDKSVKGSAGISVGPMIFGTSALFGSGSSAGKSSESDFHSSADTNTITISSKSPYPQILGIFTDKPANY